MYTIQSATRKENQLACMPPPPFISTENLPSITEMGAFVVINSLFLYWRLGFHRQRMFMLLGSKCKN